MISKRRDITLTVALCASLAAHGLLVRALADRYAQAFGVHIGFPGFPRSDVLEDDDLSAVFKQDESLGQRNGTGNATDETSGDDDMQSRMLSDAQVQPLLRRDAMSVSSGVEQEHAADPSTSTAMITSGAELDTRPISTVAALSDEPRDESQDEAHEESRRLPFGAGESNDTQNSYVSRPAPRPLQAQVATPVVVAAHPAARASNVEHASSASNSNVAAASAASAAPQGESESDPFAAIGSAEFRRGRTIVQVGRPHRIVAPRFDLRSLVDTIPLGGVHLVLALTIDQTGNVISVDVPESSGSANIDQQFRVTAYKWWFEPKGDPQGKLRERETFRFPIVIR